MGDLTLLSDYSLDTTVLSNIYIDEYMADNNEAQMKIYLYLLRNLAGRRPVSVVSIADCFNYTVLDVERSLKYMQSQGLMGLTFSEDGHITSIKMKPLKAKVKNDTQDANTVIIQNNKDNMETFEKKPSYTKAQLAKFASDEVVSRLLFVAENYIGKSLSPSDIRTICYIYDGLSFDEDLTVFVMEHCINNGNSSLDFIEKTAVIWKKAGVKDVATAKAFIESTPEEMGTVFEAFGIKGTNRKPSQGEILFVNKWLKEYNFSIDVICEACKRTVDKIHSVSFEYADAILKNYKKQNVQTLADIERVNASFTENKMAEEKKVKKTSVKKTSKQPNKFNSFSQREYDYEDLEKLFM